MEDLEERAQKAGIQIAVRTNFINHPANAVANLKVCVFKIIIHMPLNVLFVYIIGL